MKILIFGGSGFIGQNLVKTLSAEHKILVADITRGLQGNFVLADITKPLEVEGVVKNFKPEIIINLSARTDLDGNRLSDYSVNWAGSLNIHHSITKTQESPLLIHFSSMLVCKMGHTPKSMQTFCPDTVYGESKVESEKVLSRLKRNYPLLILRPTTVWGYDAGKPYSSFIKIIKNLGWLRLSIFDSKRDFCDVNQLSELIAQIVSLRNQINSDYNKCFYISDVDKKSVNDLAQIIAEANGSKVYEIKFLDSILTKLFFLMSKFGDFLSLMSINFPLNSRRISNMNMSTNLPVSDLKEEINILKGKI